MFKVYLQYHDENNLKTKVLLGQDETDEQLWTRVITPFIKEDTGCVKAPYLRMWKEKEDTYVDYGSWSKFLIIEEK
jgi:hypothetical protein